MAERYDVRLLSDPDPRWDELVRESAQGTVFATSRFGAVLERATGFALARWGIFHNDNLIAGCAAATYRRFGFAQALTPPFVPGAGFLFRSAPTQYPCYRESELLAAEQQLARELGRRFARVDLACAPSLVDVRGFVWQGWQAPVVYTYVVDLEHYSLEQVEPYMRRRVRKAEEAGFTIDRCADWPAVARLIAASYARHHHRPPFRTRYVEKLFAALETEDLLEVWGAHDREGALVSALLVLKDRTTCYGGVLGTRTDALRTGVNALLTWRVLDRTRAHAVRFDLMGATVESVAAFKAAFGGRQVPCFRIQHSTRAFRLLAGVYRRARPAWSWE